MNSMCKSWRGVLRASALAVVVAACGGTPAKADEGLGGHYPPGFGGFGAGILPDERGLYFADIHLQYFGAVGANQALPIGGVARFGVVAYSFGAVPTFTYVTGKKLLGGTVGMTLAPTVLYLDATAAVAAGSALATVQETNLNLGDTYVSPLTLGWNRGNLHWTGVLGFYAPTGEYQRSELAPAGKNFWTIEPLLGFTYLNPKSGWETSALTGIDFNTTNPATDYKTGDDFHVDFLVGNHVIRPIITPEIQKALAGAKQLAEAAASGQLTPPPAPGAPGEGKGEAKPAPKLVIEDVAIGLGGSYYQQVTGDSGAGAKLGPFRGRAFALGPALLGQANFGKTPVTFQMKILKEFATVNRLQGLSGWFIAGLKL
jgi:hypothetical protein